MKTRILVCLLSLLVVAAMSMGPVSGTDSQQTVQLSEIDVVVGSSTPGAFSDSTHEVRCGGLAPLEPCMAEAFLPADVTQISLGGTVSPGFTGWLLIKLETPPFGIDILCEVLVAGVGPVVCNVVGGQGLLLGTTVTMTIDFDPIAIGEYEFFAAWS